MRRIFDWQTFHRLSLLCLFLVNISSSLLAEELEVLALEYPPFTTQQDPSGGICFQYLAEHELFKGRSRKFKPVFVPPARAEALLAKATYCMAFYPPRSNHEDFAFFPLKDKSVRLGFIRKKQSEDFRWTSLDELKGKSMAILRSNIKSPFLSDLISAGLQPAYVESIAQGLRMLKAGRVDYAFGDETTLSFHERSIGLDVQNYQFSETSLLEVPIGFYYRLSCKQQIFGHENVDKIFQ